MGNYCCTVERECCIPIKNEDTTAPPLPPGPVDPFNCADGALNWRSEWSGSKKRWCCDIHGKGCPPPGGNDDAVPAAQYDCDAGYANWVKGWSILKKNWCCIYAQ